MFGSKQHEEIFVLKEFRSAEKRNDTLRQQTNLKIRDLKTPLMG